MTADERALRARLRVESGELTGREIPLRRTETLLGRSPASDVALLDENVSRDHALILFDEESGEFSIEDLQSTNGTLVNGKRCRSQVLQAGDAIRIGRTELRFLRD